MTQMTEQQIYTAIRNGFAAYHGIARAQIARNWAKMAHGERGAAARALVYLGGVARNPAEYFSRAATEEDWLWRANSCAREKGIGANYAFYIVPDPTIMVLNNVPGAFDAKTSSDFFYFCSLVQKWEYNRTDNKAASDLIAAQSANKIIKLAERVSNQAKKIAQFNNAMKPVMQVKRGIMTLVRGNRQK